MMATAAVCRTRIRYSHLLVHLVDGDLTGGVEVDLKSSFH
jgi:hypothetical protein